VELVL